MIVSPNPLASTARYLDTFIGYGAVKWMREHTDVPVVIGVLYLFLVLYIPQHVMKHRPAMNLGNAVRLWNLALALFSACGSYYCVPRLAELVFSHSYLSGMLPDPRYFDLAKELFPSGSVEAERGVFLFDNNSLGIHGRAFKEQYGVFDSVVGFSRVDLAHINRGALFNFVGTHKDTVREVSNVITPISTGGLHTSACMWNPGILGIGPVAFWILAFDISKIPEMLDTVFLVLQKKPVIFLHWYHHLTVMLYCWHAHVNVISSGLWFATMNYCVHSIMYFYYFVCSMGYRKVVRPFAPVITILQILQMVVGIGITLYTAVSATQEECGVNKSNLRLGLIMYGTYFALFSILFKGNYLSSKVSASRSLIARTQSEDSTSSETEVKQVCAASESSSEELRPSQKEVK